MPAKKKTPADRRAEQFRKMYRIGKAAADLNEDQVAAVLGITSRTLQKRRKDPDSFTMGEVFVLASLFHWSAEDIGTWMALPAS